VKALKAFSVLLVVGLLGYAALVYFKGAPSPVSIPGAAPAARKVQLPAGSELELVLLTPLESGGSEVGKKVDLIVAKDVTTDRGEIIVAKGSLASAKVTKTRSGSTIGTLTNTPARLEITLESVKATDGTVIPLAITLDDKVDAERRAVYEFSFANTHADFVESGVADLWSDPSAQATLKEVAEGVTRGQLPEGDDWKRIAEKLGLEDTQAAVEGSGQADLQKAVDGLRSGDISGLSGLDILLAARALNEVENLASGVDRQLRGMIKGRNIEAHIGTPVKAVTAEQRTVTVRPAPTQER